MSRWTGYIPGFDRAARMTGLPLPGAIRRYTQFVQDGIASGRLAANDSMTLAGELAWHRLGRPSYRVAAPLAHALTRTRLDIDAAFIRFPHAAWGIELPLGVDIRNLAGNRLEGLLVSAMRETDLAPATLRLRAIAPDGKGTWRLLVCQRWAHEDDTVSFALTLWPGVTVSERIAEVTGAGGASKCRTPQKHDVTITSDDTLGQIVSLVVGAAMFAVSANQRFVRPVTRHGRRGRRRGRKARNRPPEPRRWTLGADIVLPGGGSSPGHTGGVAGGDGGGGGRCLRFAHIRQGHLRMTPTGPRDDRRYVLRYIAPTVVRPDLPLAPRATRHRLDDPGHDDSVQET